MKAVVYHGHDDFRVEDVADASPVGVMAQRSAALFGPSAIVAVDLDDGRLAKAKQRGCIPVNSTRDDLDRVLNELTDGRDADAAIEAVGNPDLVRRCIEVLRPGGRSRSSA